jgi:enoyl-CoA hydratase/carnithine racemase
VTAAKLDTAVNSLAAAILAAGPRAIRIQKALILDWEEMHTAAAVERGIEAFVDAFSTDEPRRMTGAARAAMQARRNSD